MKEYKTPEMEVVELKMNSMLCASPIEGEGGIEHGDDF